MQEEQIVDTWEQEGLTVTLSQLKREDVERLRVDSALIAALAEEGT